MSFLITLGAIAVILFGAALVVWLVSRVSMTETERQYDVTAPRNALEELSRTAPLTEARSLLNALPNTLWPLKKALNTRLKRVEGLLHQYHETKFIRESGAWWITGDSEWVAHNFGELAERVATAIEQLHEEVEYVKRQDVVYGEENVDVRQKTAADLAAKWLELAAMGNPTEEASIRADIKPYRDQLANLKRRLDAGDDDYMKYVVIMDTVIERLAEAATSLTSVRRTIEKRIADAQVRRTEAARLLEDQRELLDNCERYVVMGRLGENVLEGQEALMRHSAQLMGAGASDAAQAIADILDSAQERAMSPNMHTLARLRSEYAQGVKIAFRIRDGIDRLRMASEMPELETQMRKLYVSIALGDRERPYNTPQEAREGLEDKLAMMRALEQHAKQGDILQVMMLLAEAAKWAASDAVIAAPKDARVLALTSA